MTSPAASLAPVLPVPPTRYALEFTGQAGEYFRIWIVNLCLTIVTLGLYGPWAKVRTRKYFYANLVLDGASFAYDADPWRILIGRLIVLGFTGAIALLQAFAPLVGVLASLLVIPLLPWMLVRSLAFHRRSSSYRNVRFGFRASVGEAACVLFGGMLFVAFTLGLAYPWYVGFFQEFQVANSRYGVTPFSFAWRARQYYRVVGVAILWGSAIGIAAWIAGGQIGSLSGDLRVGGLLRVVAGAAGYAAALAVVSAGFSNLLCANAALGGDVCFESTLRARDLVRIYGLGGLAVIASVGLALPWLLVRAARYRAEHTSVLASVSLDAFAAAAESDVAGGAIAEELGAGFFDFDFGL